MTQKYRCGGCKTEVFAMTGRCITIKKFYVLCHECLEKGIESDYNKLMDGGKDDPKMSILRKK